MTSRSHTQASRLGRRAGIGGLLALAALLPIGTASAAVTQGPGCTDGGATVTCEFWAKSTTTFAVPGGTVSAMGYAASAAGPPLLPGPTIVADEGDTVAVTLHNSLSAFTGMLFQEQPLAPDTTGVAAGGTASYSFTASQPGTYIYEASPFVRTGGTSGGGSQYQAAMGMSGALVVRPAGAPDQAYGAASTQFDAEHLVVLGELDKQLTVANSATFDMRNFSPEYHLVNGKASPQTDDLAAAAGDRVLLRYIDAGIRAHSISLLGFDQTVVGEDGNALANPRHMVAETLGAGQTDDAIVELPPSASGRYPVYDAGMWMNNNGAAGMGGMLTFLNVTGAAGGDTTGPASSALAYDGADLTATISDTATGNSSVTAAEYFVDSLGAAGSGTAMTGGFGSPTAAVTAAVTVPPGSHTLYVRGQDSAGNWGAANSLIYANSDSAKPLTRSLSLAPNPTNGTASVQLRATGDDSAAGGSDIVAAEYAIDGGTAVPIPPSPVAPVAALDITISAATVAALPAGDHSVAVRSQDSAGNWSDPATIILTKDTTGPAGSGATATPAGTNGTQAFSATIRAVRVKFTATDSASRIAAGEGFLDSAGANGSGFPLIPTDGTFSNLSESLQADIPLSTIMALPQGVHPVLLHAKDAAGNWGATTSTTVTVDRTGPTVSGLTASPNPTNVTASNNTTFALTAAATDPANLSAVTGAEWFSGTDPGTGNGTAMTVGGGPAFTLGATINFVTQGWAPGNRTISVRARDALGNWSAPVTVVVNIVPPNTIFANGFESGNASAWTGITGAGRITFPAAANMAGTGTVGMQVSVANTINTANPASAYVTDNTPAAEPTYHGRFYFNPNNSTPGGGTTGITIFAGYTGESGGGSNRFLVQYRQNGAAREVRLGVVRSGGTTNTNWFALTSNATSYIEILWQSGGSTTAELRTNGVLRQTLTGLNTGTGNRIESVRLGVQGLSGANATRSGSLWLDSFASTRRTVIGP